MDVPESPTRLRFSMHPRPDYPLGNKSSSSHAGHSTNGWTQNGSSVSSQSHRKDWRIFEDRNHFGRGWLASFTRSASDRDFLRTSKPSLWQNFHLFESPRRRALTSVNSPPSMLKFCLFCGIWYFSSAMSSNTGKTILNQFEFPITLTFVQFGFVAAYCLLLASPAVRFTRLRRPTRAILESTVPMGAFQVGGHVFSSMAISRINVSTVHTIKALSPLFTVAAYAMLFGVKYSPKTYISLLPLTIGVMLACSFDMSASNVIGLLSAFASAIVFVSSNIFFKKIMPSSTKGAPQLPAQKLDKINLLFYSSSMAFLFMIPIWLYYDLPALLSRSWQAPSTAQSHSSINVIYNFILNGIVHFGQNIIAFVILASVSPVTYSIASLFKRVAVICMSLLWFNQSVHPVQGLGICLTFIGLWMYNNAKEDVEKGENKVRRVEAAREMMLPSTKAEHRMMHSHNSPALSENEEEPVSITSALDRPIYVPPTSANGHAIDSPPPPPHSKSYAQSHRSPDLHIKIAQPNALPVALQKEGEVASDSSYPSPPLSRDSPPPSSIGLVSPTTGKSRRRGTLSYAGVHSHAHTLSHEAISAPIAGPIYVNA